MPYPPSVAALFKSDRRRQWTALKSKHSKAIAAKKIDFDSKLGPTLDKYQVQVAALEKLFAQESVNEPAVNKLLTISRPLRQIAESYLDKIKHMGDPAEKELTSFLKALEADCEAWEKVPDLLFKQTIVATNSPAQLRTVREVYGLLDALSQQLVNLRKNIPPLLLNLKKIPKKADFEEHGKDAPSEKKWRKGIGLDLGPIAASAAVLYAKTGAAQAILNQLLTASVKFNEHSDYHSFKEAALAFATGAPLTDFHQRAKSLDQLMRVDTNVRPDDHYAALTLAGADATEMRHTHLCVAEAANKLVDPLVAGIRKLP